MLKRIFSLVFAVMCLFPILPVTGASAATNDVSWPYPYDPGTCGDGVGQRLCMGLYTQNAYYNDLDYLDWRVLDRDGNKALIISEYCINAMPYNNTCQNVTWETCSLRKWLNNEFYNTVFDAEEKAAILTTTVDADGNPCYGTGGGRATKDKVFLLSDLEVAIYFMSAYDRTAGATPYAEAREAHNCGSKGCSWWIRTPGIRSDMAMIVDAGGCVNYDGDFVSITNGGVRPAMWVDVTKLP